MVSLKKVLRSKSGKTLKIVVYYDPEKDEVVNSHGKPIPDTVERGGTRIDLKRFKPKWKKALREAYQKERPKPKKKPLQPFLKEDFQTDFEEVPELYDMVYEGVDIDELSSCHEIGYLSQLTFELTTGGLKKKEFFALCTLGDVPSVTFRGHAKDSRIFEKLSETLARKLKGRKQSSGLAPKGALEEIIQLRGGSETGDVVLMLVEVFLGAFSRVEIQMLKFSKVPPEVIEQISLNPGKRISVSEHFT